VKRSDLRSSFAIGNRLAWTRRFCRYAAAVPAAGTDATAERHRAYSVPRRWPECQVVRSGSPGEPAAERRARTYAPELCAHARPANVRRNDPHRRTIQLPPDACVTSYEPYVQCTAGQSCPDPPIYELRRGAASLRLEAQSGAIIEEDIVPGDTDAFDFLRAALR